MEETAQLAKELELLLPLQAKNFRRFRPTFKDLFLEDIYNFLRESSSSSTTRARNGNNNNTRHQHHVGTILELSSSTLLVYSAPPFRAIDCVSLYYHLGIKRAANWAILATDHRAAVEKGLILLTHLASRNTLWLEVFADHEEATTSCFINSRDLQQILTSGHHIEFRRFRFAPHHFSFLLEDDDDNEGRVSLTHETPTEKEISLVVNDCFPLSMCLDLYAKILSTKKTPFGNLFVAFNAAATFSLQQVKTYLQPRSTLLSRELALVLDRQPTRDALEIVLALLECPASIHRLVIVTEQSPFEPTDFREFWSRATRTIAEGTRSIRALWLLVDRHTPLLGSCWIDEMTQLVQALSSPTCTLQEIHLLRGVSAELYAKVLEENQSLTDIVMDSTSNPLLHDNRFLQAVAGNPRIKRLSVRMTAPYSSHASMLLPMLTSKRYMEIEFGIPVFRNPTVLQTWEDLVEPARRFNRFHCGVVDDLPRTSLSHFALFRLVVLRSVQQNVRRTALLLHYHTTLLVEFF